mmetsp:Transcript_40769/g.130096  ORF Transcript_40769/g.130096 Transcript_40769/m.130096 type:complete len:226 (-) Transcript_40769:221-898(-)
MARTTRASSTPSSRTVRPASWKQPPAFDIIKDGGVERAMRLVDRGHFSPSGGQAYHDSPQVIGYGATISAPHMHAFCLELLAGHLVPGARALDVGSGTGYLSAVMAQMVGPEGRVVGVEHIPQLVEMSLTNMRKDPDNGKLMDSGRVRLLVALARRGPTRRATDSRRRGESSKSPTARRGRWVPGVCGGRAVQRDPRRRSGPARPPCTHRAAQARGTPRDPCGRV